MIGVVLDTNIMVSANLSGEGLENFVVSLALGRKLQLYVSAPILEEYERVLRYARLRFLAEDVTRFLGLVRRTGILVKPTRTVTVAKHESDNRFLECAETADTPFLVTGNKRHFPKAWKNTQVVNARELLALIGPGLLQ